MKEIFQTIKQNAKEQIYQLDLILLICMTLLITISFVMVFSATMYFPEAQNNPFFFVIKQWVGVIIGIIAMIGIVIAPYKLFEKKPFYYILNGLIIVALLFVVFAGEVRGGAKSWLSIGSFSFQPSEFAKISLILTLSQFIYSYMRQPNLQEQLSQQDDWKQWLPMIEIGSVLFLNLLLIMLQPDVGMVILIGATLSVMLAVEFFTAKTNRLLTLAIVVLAFLGTYYIQNNIDWLVQHAGFRGQRLLTFANPFYDPQDMGYQVINSFLAISEGGWLGVGLGSSLLKQGILPAAHTDFILSITAEEMGVFGAGVIIFLWGLMITRLYISASRATNNYRSSVLTGIGTMFLVQLLANVGGLLALLPLTGVTLPLVSYGGSSMIASIVALGIAQRMIIEDRNEAAIYEQLKKEEEDDDFI